MAIIQNLKNSVYLAVKIRNILVVNSSAPVCSAPGPRWGDFRPPRPPLICSPVTNPSYATGTPRFLQRWKTPRILKEFCATSGEIFNQKIVSVRSNICARQQNLWLQMNKVSWISEMATVCWWPVILLSWCGMTFDILDLLFVAITYGKV